jgi:hypothetical protein
VIEIQPRDRVRRIVGKYLSTLPEDDDHPYRTGPWRPQSTEWDADDLTIVEGEIPRDLDGVYLRNTENPLHPALKAYHPFDGDGSACRLPRRRGDLPQPLRPCRAHAERMPAASWAASPSALTVQARTAGARVAA